MFEAAVIIGFLGFLYWKLLKAGGFDFWKVAGKHPDEAYDWFMADDAWRVVDPEDTMSLPPEPKTDWDGPNWLYVPKLGGRRVTIYGKAGRAKASQRRFIEKYS